MKFRSSKQVIRKVLPLLLLGTLVVVFEYPILVSLLFSLALFVVTGDLRWYWICMKTVPRDLQLLGTLVQTLTFLKWSLRQKKQVVGFLEKNAMLTPSKDAIVSADTGQKMSFSDLCLFTSKVAGVFHAAGYEQGDVVAIFMENRLEYVPIWLGLSRLGLISSLINCNLREESLLHCLDTCKCKAVIYSSEMAEAVFEVHAKLDSNVKFFYLDEKVCFRGHESLNALMSKFHSFTFRLPSCTLQDTLMYIYTSGTTGMPKAAVIKGVRYAAAAKAFQSAFNVTRLDVVYTALPLYHTSSCFLMAGQMILSGCTLVVRKKFSASKFFEDCARHNVTIANYIGEVCRYLLAQPDREFDRAHKLRLLSGNGLRPSLWKDFQSRFSIPKIGEFYGSTEGNANIVNTVGKVGAVGFNSVAFAAFSPLLLVKVDKDTNEILRNERGLAVLCQPGEIGELLAKMDQRLGKLLPFDGYVNKSATQKKTVHNVTRVGDVAFRSGDLLLQDEEGYLYFHDRFGDTFRWKGENVSTNEVEGVISRFLHLQDVASYGVSIPGTEGKAGMICIADPSNSIDISGLRLERCAALPAYALPVFVRVTQAVDTTGTFKLIKTKLQGEGFDPDLCGDDKIYFRNSTRGKYELLTKGIYHDICCGKVRY